MGASLFVNKSVKVSRLVSGTTTLLIIGLLLGACATSPTSLPATPSVATVSLTSLPTIVPANTSLATQESTPSSPQVIQILDLAYAGDIHMLATTQTAGGTDLALLDSTDNGTAWNVYPIPGAQPAFNGEAPASNSVRHIVFLNKDIGWAYGPGLFETWDGGRIWQQVNMSQDVVGIIPPMDANSQVWALTGDCSSPLNPCTYRLLGFDTQADTWQPLSNYAPLKAGQGAVLLRPSEDSALVLAPDFSKQTEPPPLNFFLWSSQAAGTWERLDTPCRLAVQDLLSISPEGNYWLLCGGSPGAGAQGKEVYISVDQGKTWELRAFTGFGLPTPIPTLAPVTDPLPTYGYVDNLLALSNSTALAGFGRSTIYTSRDGGVNWQAAIPIETANPGGNGGWSIIRGQSSDEIWAAVGRDVFRSSDAGRTWKRVNLP